MGANYSGTFLLRDIVRKLHAQAGRRQQRHVDALRWLWRKLPLSARLRGRKMLSPVIPDIDLETKDRDYFVVRSNHDCGAIRINLEGRDPEGRVHAGRDYDSLCASISADLLQIVNVESAEPLVSEVLQTDCLFEGPRRQHLPDLNIVWNRNAPIRKISSPKIGLIERDHESGRSGDHRPTGFVLMHRGRTDCDPLPPIPATDLSTAICALLGVALHADRASVTPGPPR
jgi:predicted AlkP superfamily phosphohydrolase/phosphomutase